MWKRIAGGRTLTFQLAGINNQNFLMQDLETGSYWQQVSGRAIAGPLKGQMLELLSTDEITFGLWKAEAPGGTVLAPVPAYEQKYAELLGWEDRVGKRPTPFGDSQLPGRELVFGVSLGDHARAYPAAKVMESAPLHDLLGSAAIVLVVGPDGKSVRGFKRPGDSVATASEFFLRSGGEWALVDSGSGNTWNFEGCATEGPLTGQCLETVSLLKEYWFDWKQYHPNSSIYTR